MLTQEKILEIINKGANTSEQIEIVIKYIYDLKQVDLSKEQINLPQDHLQQILLIQMYNVATQYYLDNGNK